MSDINSGLPIRSQVVGQVNYDDVIVKVGDATTPSQQMAVGADGSINVTDNGGSLTVDAVDLDIRDLDSAQDSVEAVQATHDNLNVNANIQVGDADVANGNPVPVSDAGGSLTVDAVDLDIRDLAFATDKVDASGSVVALDAPTLAALESITVQNGAGASAVNIQDGGNSITVDAVDLDIRNLSQSQDTVQAWLRDEAGAAFSSTNPLPVVMLESEGVEVNDYSTGSAVAGGANSNHDYTVTAAKTLQLTQIEASASGKMKIEVQIESGVGTNTFATKFVKFNSTSDPNMSISLKEAIAVAAGVRVRVIRTNRDNQAQDVYSTISGHEV